MSKWTKWLLTPVAAVALLAGCGDQAEEKNNANAENGVQEIVVGTGNQMLNICFINENGDLTGYDIELLKAIDEKLEDVSFKFETMDFSNLLLSLETKKIDLLAHNMAKNPEREGKFLFNQQPYNAVPLHVVVNENNTAIQSIDDLNGKKVGLSPTSNAALFFEKYKKENNFDTELAYITAAPDMINQLKTGRIDAIFSFPFSVDINNKEADAQQKLVGDELLFTDIFFMFNKEDEALANKVDAAIQQLIEDGTVSTLLQEWFGEDYSNELVK